MNLTESGLSLILGGLIIVGLLLAFPALTTALGLLRSRAALGDLSSRVNLLLDSIRRRHGD